MDKLFVLWKSNYILSITKSRNAASDGNTGPSVENMQGAVDNCPGQEGAKVKSAVVSTLFSAFAENFRNAAYHCGRTSHLHMFFRLTFVVDAQIPHLKMQTKMTQTDRYRGQMSDFSSFAHGATGKSGQTVRVGLGRNVKFEKTVSQTAIAGGNECAVDAFESNTLPRPPEGIENI